MKKHHITALGEILIDYTPLPKSPAGMAVYEENPGGAPANVLACGQQFGLSTAFIGKVGQDTQGDFLRSTLEKEGISTQGLISDPNFFTTLAFVSLSDTGERSFAFARKPGADTQLSKEEVNMDILKESQIFHFGSLSLTHSPSREASFFALEEAKKQGAILSYDPNYRALLWNSPEEAMEQMRRPLPFVDVLKISDEECALMTGENQPEKAMNILLAQKIPVVAITLGAEGALVGNSSGVRKVSGFTPTAVVDTTGAGDSFWGGFLTKLALSQQKPEDISLEELENMVRFANATASLNVEKRGAIPAMPSLAEVNQLLKIQG